MTLHFTQSFETEYKQIIKGNIPLQNKIQKQLNMLRGNVNHPSLRLHKVNEWWSVSIDKSIRMLMVIETTDIYIYHIGKHEDMY